MIDDERFDRSPARFESEAEFFLQCDEYRGRVCSVRSGTRIRSGEGTNQPDTGKRRSLSRKLEADIEPSGSSGLVDHGTVHYRAERLGKFVERRA